MPFVGAFAAFTIASMISLCGARAQSPGVIYTWEGTGNLQDWSKNFGTNTVVLDNAISGELRITETGGTGTNVAISDGPNRTRELSAAAGGTDMTGLEFLEFDLGHNGLGVIDVQFFVQASTNYTYRALGPDLQVFPGVATYQVPLTDLLPEEAVYLRTMGFNARDHVGLGDVVWTLREVRSGGTPLEVRELVTHDTGTAENGLQGAIVNFDGTAVLGNTGQNQTGLTHNPAGSGSLQWTDVGGGPGAAISWGNGTAWNGNSFNNRPADLSNYETMTIRMSATEITPGLGGIVDVQAFFQTNNFVFQTPEGGGSRSLPLDGQFYDLTFSLGGLTDMNGVDQTGINLAAHATDLRINVDSIVFAVPEPTSTGLLALALVANLALMRRRTLLAN